jgi:hypothetical protein
VPLDRSGGVPGSVSLHVVEGYTVVVDGPGRLDGRLAATGTDDDDLDYTVRGRIGGRRVRARLTFRLRLLEALGLDSASAGRDRPGR